jgi:DNA-binding transcriptional LysR family regulator
LLPQFLGRLDNRLHSCRLDRKPPPRELWVVTRRQDLKDLPVRTIIDYLSDLFRQKRKLFEEESEDG